MSQINLIYPTIDLFIYDLREGLGQQECEIQKNRHNFWRKVYKQLDKDEQDLSKDEQELLQKLARWEKAEAEYAYLLGKPNATIAFESPLDGYYYPLQLGDTYALQVDYSGGYNQSIDSYESLDKIKQTILRQIGDLKGTIGQTWMVWGQLPNGCDLPNIVEQVAKDCCKQLKLDLDWERDFSNSSKGELLGASIFELWHTSPTWDRLEENSHVLICLFPLSIDRQQLPTIFQHIYFDLMRLFAYRHKIVWAYYQSRKLKQLLKLDFTILQQEIHAVGELSTQNLTGRADLESLQLRLSKNLKSLSRYAENLSYLEAQGHTIEINIENYQKRLEKIQRENDNFNLEFLSKFGEFAHNKYLNQVQKDHTTLSPGLMLLEKLLATISGIVEIEQTKSNIAQIESDRSLNKTIAIAGIGLATSQLASAAIIAQFPPKENISPAFYLSATFGASLLVGLLCIGLALLLLSGFGKNRTLQQKRNT
jgi:hypothetical protein